MGKMGKKSLGVPLGEWFERQRRVLPWRDEPSLYRVWVSEIMLQQTQVVTVVPYFEKFMRRFPTVESLAEASADDVMLHWAGLGYYSRARNLHAGAKAIVAGAFGAPGAFPRTREGWLSVKGVGAYTAGAILSIALDRPEAILDGNVERVLSRVRRVDRAEGDAAYKARLWELSRAEVAAAQAAGVRPSVFNQALMELGAMVCTPRNAMCAVCPVADRCEARAALEVDLYPPRKKPKEWIRVEERTVCLVDGQGRVLVERRPEGQWRAGLWDLPAAAAGGKLLGEVETKHVVTRHKITRLTEVRRAGLRAAESEGAERRWVSLREPEVAVGSALKRTLQAVRERFF